MTSEPELWTVAECCEHCGLTSHGTWRRYVWEGRAPKPLPGYDEQRRRQWNADEVRAWHASRPRPRASDLREKS